MTEPLPIPEDTIAVPSEVSLTQLYDLLSERDQFSIQIASEEGSKVWLSWDHEKDLFVIHFEVGDEEASVVSNESATPPLKKDSNYRTRRFVLVCNNYPENLFTTMPEWAPELFKYFCCKKEIGDSGTPHLQCYGECINPHTLKTLQNALSKKSRIPSRWAAFVAKGTGRQNLDYVSKTGPPDYEHGVLKTQGQRSDLEEVAELINQDCAFMDNNRVLALGRDRSWEEPMGQYQLSGRVLQGSGDRLVGWIPATRDSDRRRLQTFQELELCQDPTYCRQVPIDSASEMWYCPVCFQTYCLYLPPTPPGYFFGVRVAPRRGFSSTGTPISSPTGVWENNDDTSSFPECNDWSYLLRD